MVQGSNVGLGLSKDQSMWSYRRERRTLRAVRSPCGIIPGLSPLQAWAAALELWGQGKEGETTVYSYFGDIFSLVFLTCELPAQNTPNTFLTPSNQINK